MSPANVEASVLYRRYKAAPERKKQNHDYAKIVREQVERSRQVAKEMGIVVPETIDEYVQQRRSSSTTSWNQSLQNSIDEDEDLFYPEDESDVDISIPLDTSTN